MKRVIVIGSGGAGKSWFSSRLGERTGLPVIHLDALYWGAGWTEPPKDEWRRVISELLKDEEWVIDGNYGGTLDQRLRACDTVIFLDVPRLTCLRRVLARRIRFHGRSRPDMSAGCPERLSWEFLRWIWTYPAKRRPAILQKLSILRPGQRAIVLDSTRSIERFLESVTPNESESATRTGAGG